MVQNDADGLGARANMGAWLGERLLTASLPESLAAAALVMLLAGVGGTVAGVGDGKTHVRMEGGKASTHINAPTSDTSAVTLPLDGSSTTVDVGGAATTTTVAAVGAAAPGTGDGASASVAASSGAATTATGSVTAAPAPVANSGNALTTPTTAAPAAPDAAATTTTVAPAPAPGGVPTPGVYSYNTSGNQQITLLGATNLPSVTKIVVTTHGCGVQSAWQTSSTSAAETVVECPVPGGMHIASETEELGAAGSVAPVTFQCPTEAFLPLAPGAPGQTWTWKCSSSGGETATSVAKVVGTETAVIAGVAVSALHVSVDGTLAGAQQGAFVKDYWFTSNGTPVKESGSTSSAMGVLKSSLSYSLQLISLTPGH